MLDEIDAWIEAGDDEAVRKLQPELMSIANDSDVAPALRKRADVILGVMGVEEARQRHSEMVKEFGNARDRARQILETALAEAQKSAGFDIGDGVRQAVISLCGHLLIIRPEEVSSDMIDWSVQSLVRAMADRFGSYAGS